MKRGLNQIIRIVLLVIFTGSLVFTQTPAVLSDVLVPSTTRVSLTAAGGQSNGASGGEAYAIDLTSDGRYVVFQSTANNLTGSAFSQIVFKDTQTSALEVVSVSSSEVMGNGNSTNPAVSSDGRYVVFTSAATNLASGDGNNTLDVFLRDRQNGTTELISRNALGASGNGASDLPDLSANGRYVVYRSWASDLITGDTKNRRDVFLYDRQTATTIRLNLTSTGGEALDESAAYRPAISDDGTKVVFDTLAMLTPVDDDFNADVYLRDLTAGTLRLLSTDENDENFFWIANDPAISGDGQFAAFVTINPDILPHPMLRTHRHLYVRNLDTWEIQRATVSSDGVPGRTQDIEEYMGDRHPSLSYDGRFVAYQTGMVNLVSGDTNSAYDVFVHDLQTGATERVSVSTDGVQGNDDSKAPVISPDGTIIIYNSISNTLVLNDTNDVMDVFKRDPGDLLGPVILNLEVVPNPASYDQIITINATASDSGRGDADILQAEFQFDGGSWLPMSAVDGAFDSPVEDVTGQVIGRFDQERIYPVCVRATDEADNLDLPECIDLVVTVPDLPLAVTITRITSTGSGLDVGSAPDYFVWAWVDPGGSYDINAPMFHNEDEHTSNRATVEPFWNFGKANIANGTPKIVLRAWDDDSEIPDADDEADINPDPAKKYLELEIDIETGRWSGDVTWPQNCSLGDGAGAVTICWETSIWSESGDLDGDGLLDAWEVNGLDMDGDGAADVDLPALGADLMRKDLFLELDYLPGQAPAQTELLAMKAAFAAAPLDNPDGSTGVNLWIDTGTAVDPAAAEIGQTPNCSDGLDNDGDGKADGADPQCKYLDVSVEAPLATCSDGLDNDGDLLADALDPDCLTADDLGGGNEIVAAVGCLDNSFYTAKAANFDLNRRWAFRYAISGDPQDGAACGGGRAENGGNDLVDYNHDGGTLMHLFGHTLGLLNGGNNSVNCKPNYVSVMNYDHLFGIRRSGGGHILDFSPPRISLDGSLRSATLPPNLAESNLNENTILDPADSQNIFLYVNALGQKIWQVLSGYPNWNGDADPPRESGRTVNINTVGLNGEPAGCANGTSNETLRSFNDWNAVVLPVHSYDVLAGSAVRPSSGVLPVPADLPPLEEELRSTDLTVTVRDAPDPVAAGQALVYTLTVTNAGNLPAGEVVLTGSLAAEFSFSSGAGCTGSGTSFTCNLGELAARQQVQFTVTVLVADGTMGSRSSTFTVENLLGPELNAADNSASATTEVTDSILMYLPVMHRQP